MAPQTAPTARERSLAFNQAYPIGTPVFYHRRKGKPVPTFTTGTSWDTTAPNGGRVYVELAPAPGLPAGKKSCFGGYDIVHLTPNPSGTPGPPYGTVPALCDLLAATFHIGLLDEQRTAVADFARQVCAANRVERLRQQLTDYLVCGYLRGQPLSASFASWSNQGGDFMLGNWNTQDYATQRAQAEAQLALEGSAL